MQTAADEEGSKRPSGWTKQGGITQNQACAGIEKRRFNVFGRWNKRKEHKYFCKIRGAKKGMQNCLDAPKIAYVQKQGKGDE